MEYKKKKMNQNKKKNKKNSVSNVGLPNNRNAITTTNYLLSNIVHRSHLTPVGGLNHRPTNRR